MIRKVSWFHVVLEYERAEDLTAPCFNELIVCVDISRTFIEQHMIIRTQIDHVLNFVDPAMLPSKRTHVGAFGVCAGINVKTYRTKQTAVVVALLDPLRDVAVANNPKNHRRHLFWKPSIGWRRWMPMLWAVLFDKLKAIDQWPICTWLDPMALDGKNSVIPIAVLTIRAGSSANDADRQTLLLTDRQSEVACLELLIANLAAILVPALTRVQDPITLVTVVLIPA